MVHVLISQLTLLAWWDCLVFSLHNLCLSWLRFGAVYFRPPRWLYIICGGFAWTICFSWYSQWSLLDVACPDRFDWSTLCLDTSLDSWLLQIFHLRCHILLGPLMNLPPRIHDILRFMDNCILHCCVNIYLFVWYCHKIYFLLVWTRI